MTFTNYGMIIGCVLAIATGQIMFKLTARSLAGAGGVWEMILSPTLFAALVIYGVATLVWIWQLRYVDLSRAYPFMALSFVIVPLASMLVLNEAVGLKYWIGVGMIVGGIVLTIG